MIDMAKNCSLLDDGDSRRDELQPAQRDFSELLHMSMNRPDTVPPNEFPEEEYLSQMHLNIRSRHAAFLSNRSIKGDRKRVHNVSIQRAVSMVEPSSWTMNSITAATSDSRKDTEEMSVNSEVNLKAPCSLNQAFVDSDTEVVSEL